MRDIDEILDRLATSAFRRRFKLSDADRAYLAQKGLVEVLDHARGFIEKRLAAADPANDGKQTPFRGHPVFVAQHATATCCRGCLAKWHSIERGHALGVAEQNYIADVIEYWLKRQAVNDTEPKELRLL